MVKCKKRINKWKSSTLLVTSRDVCTQGATRKFATFASGRLRHLLKIGRQFKSNFVLVKLCNRSRTLRQVATFCKLSMTSHFSALRCVLCKRNLRLPVRIYQAMIELWWGNLLCWIVRKWPLSSGFCCVIFSLPHALSKRVGLIKYLIKFDLLLFHCKQIPKNFQPAFTAACISYIEYSYIYSSSIFMLRVILLLDLCIDCNIKRLLFSMREGCQFSLIWPELVNYLNLQNWVLRFLSLDTNDVRPVLSMDLKVGNIWFHTEVGNIRLHTPEFVFSTKSHVPFFLKVLKIIFYQKLFG